MKRGIKAKFVAKLVEAVKKGDFILGRKTITHQEDSRAFSPIDFEKYIKEAYMEEDVDFEDEEIIDESGEQFSNIATLITTIKEKIKGDEMAAKKDLRASSEDPSKSKYTVNKTNVEEGVKKYLIPKLCIQKTANSAIMSIKNKDGGAEYWLTSPDISRTPVVNSLLLSISEMYDDMREWRAQVVLAIAQVNAERSSQKPKPPIVTFRGLVADCVNDILSGAVESCIIEEGSPLLAWDSEAVVSLKTSDLVDGPTPTFDGFLSRVEFPETLMAFVWKIFDADDCKGRQMVWGVSAGNAGQSSFWASIKSLIPALTVSMQNSSNVNQFSESKFYRKRLAIMADCEGRNFHEQQIVKKLTGGDIADMERKGQDSFTADIWSRVVIHSNKYPSINTFDNSIMTRVLVIPVRSIPDGEEDLKIKDKYAEELWHFLYKCREVANRLCPSTNGQGPRAQIPVPEEMVKLIYARCEEPERLALRYFCNKKVEIKKGSKLLEKDLWDSLFECIKERCQLKAGNIYALDKKKNSLLDTFTQYMEKTHRIDIRKVVDDDFGYYYPNICLVQESTILSETTEQQQEIELDTSDMDL